MNKITLNGIKVMVSKKLHISIGRTIRKRDYVYGRAIYYKLSKEFTGQSLANIGGNVGRDHASVIHGFKVFEMIKLYNDSYMDVYLECRRILTDIKNDKDNSEHSDYWRDKYDNLKELYVIAVEKLAKYEKEKVT